MGPDKAHYPITVLFVAILVKKIWKRGVKKKENTAPGYVLRRVDGTQWLVNGDASRNQTVPVVSPFTCDRSRRGRRHNANMRKGKQIKKNGVKQKGRKVNKVRRQKKKPEKLASHQKRSSSSSVTQHGRGVPHRSPNAHSTKEKMPDRKREEAPSHLMAGANSLTNQYTPPWNCLYCVFFPSDTVNLFPIL